MCKALYRAEINGAGFEDLPLLSSEYRLKDSGRNPDDVVARLAVVWHLLGQGSVRPVAVI